MSDEIDDLQDSLPVILPIFPLDGTLLLPHGHLPLHIFEPRYRAMVEASLGNGRMLGMIQPRTACDHPLPDDVELFEVGCAGRIVSFAETDDGRFLITLRGVCRFRVGHELPMRQGFRRIRADFSGFLADLDAPEAVELDRGRLLSGARQYLQLKEISCDWAAVEQASLPALITSLAMICPFDPGEKQALLECPGLSERGMLLMSLFDMAILEGETAAAATRH
jgi:hypothetical protein